MEFVFRADASGVIGIGHIVRCLTLADSLRERGDRCVFVCCDGGGLEFVEAAGFEAVTAASAVNPAQDAVCTAMAAESLGVSVADWLVVDHYGLDSRYESACRSFARRVAVIDDIGDRAHDCDLLVDQNLRTGGGGPYDGLVPESCATLLGPRFALVRPEFAATAAARGSRDGIVRRILLFFGGGDPTGQSVKALRALLSLDARGVEVDVVMSGASPFGQEVKSLSERLPGAQVHWHVRDMAALMSCADLMLGTGGSTSWERCVLGLPSITVTVADNQVPPTLALAECGATLFAGCAQDVTAEALAAHIANLLADPQRVVEIGRAARAVTGDARGATLVASTVHCLSDPVGCTTLRPLGPEDSDRLRAWRNSDRVRAVMGQRHVVSASEHDAWFVSTLDDPSVRHSVLECCGAPLGLVSFKELDPATRSASWGFYIGEPWAPTGSGSRMAILALDHAFGTMGLEEIRAEVLSSNEASVAFHGKLGFRRTKTVRRTAHDGPETLEWTKFALTTQDWATVRSALSERYFRKAPA